MRWAGQPDEPRPSRAEDPYTLFSEHSAGLSGHPSHRVAPDLGIRGLACCLLGIAVGALVAAAELRPEFNYHTWAYWSFASGSLGVWVISAVLIACLASSPRSAAVGTASFLASVIVAYFGVRYVNFNAVSVQVIASMSETMSAKYSALHDLEFWTPGKIGAFVTCMAAVGLAAFDSWGLRRFAGRSPWYWAFASAPLCLVAFEGWSYFVPMAAYVQIGFVPAVVDVAGSLLIAFLVVRLRSDGLAGRRMDERRRLARAPQEATQEA